MAVCCLWFEDKEMKNIATLVLLAVITSNAAATSNYQDWWWNPALDGMGFNVSQQGDTVVVAWYFYEPSGDPTFLLLAGPLVDDVVEGTLWRSSGPPPGPGYDPGDVVRNDVGSAILAFESGNSARFVYDYNGGSGTILLQRFSYDMTDTSGVWDYIGSGEVSDCILSVNEGPYTVSGYLSIIQDSSTVAVVQVYDTGEVCTYNLNATQNGSYVDASGTYSCNFGIAGIASFHGIRVIDDSLTFGLETTMTNGETCKQQGRVAAVKEARTVDDDTPPDGVVGPIY
jgi:hypothetical protein